MRSSSRSTPKKGKELWRRDIGSLNASSPAYSNHRLFAVNLSPPQIVAMRATDGKIVWQKPLPSRAESSPLYHDGRIYFGTESGDFFALRHQGRQDALADEARGIGQGGTRLPGRLALRRRLCRRLLRASGPPTAGSRWLRRAAVAASIRRRRSPSAASTSATSTGASTASTARRATWPGRTRPAISSIRGSRPPTRNGPRRPSTSAPMTATSTPSTPRPATPAGVRSPAARSAGPPP